MADMPPSLSDAAVLARSLDGHDSTGSRQRSTGGSWPRARHAELKTSLCWLANSPLSRNGETPDQPCASTLRPPASIDVNAVTDVQSKARSDIMFEAQAVLGAENVVTQETKANRMKRQVSHHEQGTHQTRPPCHPTALMTLLGVCGETGQYENDGVKA